MLSKAKKPLNNYEQAYSFALNRLSYRDHSQKDLEIKMQQRACPPEIVKTVIEKLQEYSFLDDAKYAEKVFAAWMAKKYYGVNHLRLELKKRHVSDELSSKMIGLLSEEAELERAFMAAKNCQKKNNKKYDQTNSVGKANLARALFTRGFNGNIIRLALNRLGCDCDE